MKRICLIGFNLAFLLLITNCSDKESNPPIAVPEINSLSVTPSVFKVGEKITVNATVKDEKGLQSYQILIGYSELKGTNELLIEFDSTYMSDIKSDDISKEFDIPAETKTLPANVSLRVINTSNKSKVRVLHDIEVTQ